MLENFAYGDTPSREALAALLDELLAGAPGDELVVAEYDVSTRHDVRPLVLKTLLTYLELEGLLRQGTPFYAGYRVRPLGEDDFDALFARFDAARAAFLRRVVAAGKHGRVWVTLAPDEVAAALGEERSRVVSALGYLEDQGLVELQPAEPRQRYAVIARPETAPRSWTRWPRASSAASAPRSSASSACSRSSPPTTARCARSWPTSASSARRRAATAATACRAPSSFRRPPRRPRRNRWSARTRSQTCRPSTRTSSGSRASSRASCAACRARPRRAPSCRATSIYGALAAHHFADVLFAVSPANA